MLFAPKTKGYVCDRGEQSTLVARLSSMEVPLVIEALGECLTGDHEGLQKLVTDLSLGKRVGYLKAYCGISPDQRFVRRATLDPKRLKESDYLTEIAASQFRVDVEQNAVAVLNAFDGLEFDHTAAAPSKEVIYCGLPNTEVVKSQESLLAFGLYPERLELSSLAALGAVHDYLRFTESAKPTIVLELGSQSTQSYIVSSRGLEATRPIAVGLEAMVPVVQKELGLKDEESARKLFFSNTFDFSGMGAALCKRLLKELQSSMGFYEVQTGQSIGQLVCTVLPSKLGWLESVIASQIGVAVLQPDFGPWLSARGVTLAEGISVQQMDARKLGLLGLIMKFTVQSNAVAA